MNNIIIINKNETNEIKVAFIENNELSNIEIESEKIKTKKGNIFKGFVSKIESSLDAFFVDYGSNKDGFLPFKEISKEYLNDFEIFDGINEKKDYSNFIGKSLIVQIEKEECDIKGASLTTYINLAGCYIVLMPYSKELKGISKKINNKNRFILKKLLNNIKINEKTGVIIRTFGHGKNLHEFKAEMLILLSQLKFIKYLYNNKFSKYFLYEQNNLIIRTIKDYAKFEISQIIIDDIKIFNYIYKYLSIMESKLINKLNLYTENIPILNKFEINKQIEILLKREIFLPSGGSITIDSEEALTFIDINSSKSNKCDDIEETSLQTNLEAIPEIAKQLKIRDLSGLIIIDFIDNSFENFNLIEKKFKEAINIDKAKIQMEKISKFGLLEMSREKIKSINGEKNFTLCNKCEGTGKINNLDINCSNILKSIETELMKNNIKQINLETSNKISNYITNNKKNDIKSIEKIYNAKITIIANEYLTFPEYKLYSFERRTKFLKNEMPGGYLLSL